MFIMLIPFVNSLNPVPPCPSAAPPYTFPTQNCLCVKVATPTPTVTPSSGTQTSTQNSTQQTLTPSLATQLTHTPSTRTVTSRATRNRATWARRGQGFRHRWNSRSKQMGQWQISQGKGQGVRGCRCRGFRGFARSGAFRECSFGWLPCQFWTLRSLASALGPSLAVRLEPCPCWFLILSSIHTLIHYLRHRACTCPMSPLHRHGSEYSASTGLLLWVPGHGPAYRQIRHWLAEAVD